MNYNLIGNIFIPLLTAGVTIVLFLHKLHSDSRKYLNDLLLDLEHRIHHDPQGKRRVEIFHDAYLEIRKAAHEYERWLIPRKRRKFREALRAFRGQSRDESSIRALIGTENEGMVDVFLANRELNCISPEDDEYTEFINRIAALKRFTGSK